MKYLIITLTILFTSCNGYIPNQLTVKSFESHSEILCEYEVSTQDGFRNERVYFIDTCGLYKIGDSY